MDGGGWAFHAGPDVFAGDKFALGPDVFAGDKFALGPIMSSGILLLGSSTWEMFACRWPTRTGEFADSMNAATKVVVSSRTLTLDTWSNSVALEGELVDGVQRLAEDRDVAVIGSLGVVHQLVAADAIDEFRLLTIPTAIGRGTPLFATPTPVRLTSIESTGPASLAYYERVREPVAAG